MAAADRTSRPSSQLRDAFAGVTGRFRSGPHRNRKLLVGLLAVVVLIVGLAVALGGNDRRSSESTSAGVANLAPSNPSQHSADQLSIANGTAVAGAGSAGGATAPELAPAGSAVGAPSRAQSSLTSGSAGSAPSANTPPRVNAAANDTSGSADSATATKIVKTGTIELTVGKGKVGSTISKLSSIATDDGGYVASSQTDTGSMPSGEITLRIPVAKFGTAVAAASALGKVVHESTHAQDVTGKYVDLNARKHALEQTRSTYLTILSHASSIGATLAVQDRIDQVQQQIDELHGEIKVLGNQSSYSTLTADVSEQGKANAVVVHHERTGLAKAWHTSWSRFSRGIDAIVGAIGPIVLALLLIGLFALVIWLIARATQRTRPEETVPTTGH